jgi:hypothetical protein
LLRRRLQDLLALTDEALKVLALALGHGGIRKTLLTLHLVSRLAAG